MQIKDQLFIQTTKCKTTDTNQKTRQCTKGASVAMWKCLFELRPSLHFHRTLNLASPVWPCGPVTRTYNFVNLIGQVSRYMLQQPMAWRGRGHVRTVRRSSECCCHSLTAGLKRIVLTTDWSIPNHVWGQYEQTRRFCLVRGCLRLAVCCIYDLNEHDIVVLFKWATWIR